MRIKNIDVVTLHDVLKNQTVTIENGRFMKITPTVESDTGDDYSGFMMLPGFIDVHQHGTEGFDLMDGDPKSIEAISLNLLK